MGDYSRKVRSVLIKNSKALSATQTMLSDKFYDKFPTGTKDLMRVFTGVFQGLFAGVQTRDTERNELLSQCFKEDYIFQEKVIDEKIAQDTKKPETDLEAMKKFTKKSSSSFSNILIGAKKFLAQLFKLYCSFKDKIIEFIPWIMGTLGLNIYYDAAKKFSAKNIMKEQLEKLESFLPTKPNMLKDIECSLKNLQEELPY